MAKMMFENLNSIVANTLTDSIKMIDVDELHNSEDNFFDINRIEEFAETILGQGGVKDNLIVRPLDSGYEIISGHRRKAAVQYLLDNGENISRYLPCLVQNYDDNDDKMLDIVLMNISSRQISDSEMWKSYEIVDRILKNKKSAGEKFGRVRDKLAEYLGVSASQVKKIQNIDNNAIESVKNAIENGELSIHAADKIASLEKSEQEKIAQSGLNNLKPKDIPKKKSEKSGTNTTFSENDVTEFDDQPEEIDFNNDFSENDTIEHNDKPEKSGTNTTFSKDDMTESDDTPKESVKYNTFSEDDISEPDEPTTEITLADFIHEHYFDLESIFTTYISMTDNPEETELLEEFQKLLYQTKEAERNKSRFRP